MTEDHAPYLNEQAQRVILAAIDRDDRTVGRTIEEIGVTCGHTGVFALCYALAHSVQKIMFPEVARGDGSLTGDMVTIQVYGEPASMRSASMLWTARFVASYINGDDSTATGLFFGCLEDPEQAMSNVAALVGLVGDVARQKEQESAD